MLGSLIGASLAAGTALLALGAVNKQWAEEVDPAVDRKWMQASIDAMPRCHFLAYGSVSGRGGLGTEDRERGTENGGRGTEDTGLGTLGWGH